MLQFHLSKNAAKDLKPHLSESSKPALGTMQWYGHRVTIMHRKCLLMMEMQSRYCMVFAGLTKPGFEQFPELFAERLQNEVVSICQLEDQRAYQLAELIQEMSQEQHYQIGSDRSVQAHINQAVDELSFMANFQEGRLPELDEEQFGCGVRINQTPRKTKSDKDFFFPLEKFRDFWLGMLEFSKMKLEPQHTELPDNVVPFRRH